VLTFTSDFSVAIDWHELLSKSLNLRIQEQFIIEVFEFMYDCCVVIVMRKLFLWESALQSCNDFTSRKITRRRMYKAEG